MDGNKKKAEQLGMPFGTANGRLKKIILFELLKKYSENVCYRCSETIDTPEELSIEHKKPWLDNDINLFWDLDNIAFAHLSCNIAQGRRPTKGNIKHGAHNSYRRGCRCEECLKAHAEHNSKYR